MVESADRWLVVEDDGTIDWVDIRDLLLCDGWVMGPIEEARRQIDAQRIAA